MGDADRLTLARLTIWVMPRTCRKAIFGHGRAFMDAPYDLHAELLRATAAQDDVAFAELYRQTSSRLYGIARRLLRDPDLANEALQETFMRIWTRAQYYDRDRGSPLHWMASLTRHICIDMLRRRSAQPVADLDIATLEIPVPAQEGASPDLERCVGQLEANEAQALMLAVHHGLSHTELAQRFNVPLGTMKSTIRRSLLKLRSCLEPNDGLVQAS